MTHNTCRYCGHETINTYVCAVCAANLTAEFCAAHGCPKAAIWAAPIHQCGATFLVPVCREHGAPLSPIHGIVGLDNFMRRKPAVSASAPSDELRRGDDPA